MATINLKDFYYWYTQDQFIEVSDEVAEVFLADARHEMAYQRRLSRHKAQYSLDCEDGIEYSACLHEPTPQELLERMELFIRLWNALNSLPEAQGRRVDACVILGKTYSEVSRKRGAAGCGAWFGEHEKILKKISLNQSEYHLKMSRFMRGGFLFSADEQGRPRA